MASRSLVAFADRAALLQAVMTARREPLRVAAEGPGETVAPFRHDDFKALVARFAPAGRVDYANFRRVRRLLEAYLSRMSLAQPEQWTSPSERLAFYLNAFNAVAIHQVLLNYPIQSLCDVPTAFSRPYPIGRELHTLHTLVHTKIRALGDPRVHAALVPASMSAPPLSVYSGIDLDACLNAQMRSLLGNPVYGLRLDASTGIVALNMVFRWFAGDFAAPTRMPSIAALIRGIATPRIVLDSLRSYMPKGGGGDLEGRRLRLTWLRYDWTLNTAEA